MLRVLALGALLGVCFLILGARLFVIQVLRHDGYRARAIAQQEAREIDRGLRGDIIDRGGRVLVRSLADHSLTVDPARVRDRRALAVRLAEHLDRPVDEVHAHLAAAGVPLALTVHLPDPVAQAIAAEELRGVRVEPPGRRLKLVAGCGWVGALNHAGDAIEGVERSMDRYLRGEDGWHWSYRDANGDNVPSLAVEMPGKPPRHGDHVVLAIDSRLQWMVEEVLARGVAAHGARSGTVVLVDVWSGEVLALAATGDAIEAGRAIPRVRAVEDVFEPGSTFKVTTFAAALDHGILDDDSVYFAEHGVMDFGGFIIRDVKRMGWLCAADVLAQSSNICTAKIG
ncbi:MAG: penicillin-binding transpeptidase domain-containing protein, partial [Candidatus Eiseniibacteriota bacterium]